MVHVPVNMYLLCKTPSRISAERKSITIPEVGTSANGKEKPHVNLPTTVSRSTYINEVLMPPHSWLITRWLLTAHAAAINR
jgi:hypothetical protein